MTSLTIDDLDADLTEQLSRRAASHGRSVQQEALRILQRELSDKPRLTGADTSRLTGADLAASIRAKFAPFGGVELEIPPREPFEPFRFDE